MWRDASFSSDLSQSSLRPRPTGQSPSSSLAAEHLVSNKIKERRQNPWLQIILICMRPLGSYVLELFFLRGFPSAATPNVLIGCAQLSWYVFFTKTFFFFGVFRRLRLQTPSLNAPARLVCIGTFFSTGFSVGCDSKRAHWTRPTQLVCILR
jgi:hypothetical protein